MGQIHKHHFTYSPKANCDTDTDNSMNTTAYIKVVYTVADPQYLVLFNEYCTTVASNKASEVWECGA